MRYRPTVGVGVVVLAGCGAGLWPSQHGGGSSEAPRPHAEGELIDGDLRSSSAAFNNPFAALTAAQLVQHQLGDRLSDVKFVTAPAPVYGGLGPLYNNNSCTGCHRLDGRGLPVLAPETGASQLITKVSLASGGEPDEPGGPIPVPGIGGQIQDQAVYGMRPVATSTLSWEEHPLPFPDGTPASLRSPRLVITKHDGSALPPGLLTSLRLPPAFFGLGLLAAVSDEALLQNEAASHRQGRTPGHVNHVWSRSEQRVAIGRFGRKANKATIRDQVALALAADIGLDNSVFPGADGTTEVDDTTLAALTFYIRTLAPPKARTEGQAQALRGEQIFRKIGCNGCHVETMRTGMVADVMALSEQDFHPYSDLLLHDMGPDLADGRADFTATGSEWRTPPLWGIGLQSVVTPYACYLHDGRARSLTEAILWHGGQALGRREAFRALRSSDRDDLLAFLQSL